MELTPIAHIENDFPTKFGLPRQSGMAAHLTSAVVMEPPFRVPEAFRGIEDFEYLWLIWLFEPMGKREWSPTVRPPKLGGNKRMGVFATRSPFRPNPLGLSSVRLLRVDTETDDAPQLYIAGADIVDGTPIYDIKPYIPYADSHPDARGGFAQQAPERSLSVRIPDRLLELLPAALHDPLRDTIALDPRPHYQDDPQRLYSMPFDRWEVRFRVEDGIAVVEDCVLNKVNHGNNN
jgi:tRNA-Thr(GGU) m(6)t(6)A37 methyltransferase TsaA